MRETAAGGDGAAHWCWRMARGVAARAVGSRRGTGLRTPLGDPGGSGLRAESSRKTRRACDAVGCRSRAGAKIGRRACLVGKKIIGRDLRGFAPGMRRGTAIAICRDGAGRLAWLEGGGAFALLHQPTSQHGRGVLFEPGIEQLGDLLAEIGSMAQARQFVTLQGITGRRQKELPGRLGFVIQGDLQGTKPVDSTRLVNVVKSAYMPRCCGKLCKSPAGGQEQRGFADPGSAAL